MKDVIFLYSKDALSTEYLSLYSGNERYGKTPNLNALAAKGTVFTNHHTAGGSTSMAFSSMLTGKYPFEFENRKTYTEVADSEKESIFDLLQAQGYECHVMWSPDYESGAHPYVKEFGDEEKTQFHVLNMYQPLGYKSHGDAPLERNDTRLEKSIRIITDELDKIDISHKTFVWLHLPHVLRGRICYGDDIDAFDRILGHIRGKFGDDSIYVTADHGNMNMHKGKVGYGFDVYNPVTRVPLVTPRINGLEVCDSLTSHVDLIDLLLYDKIPKHEYVYCDSAYYAQPQRKLAVIGKRFKYIYNRQTKTEELYDLEWDRAEEYNILKESYLEKNRMGYVTYSELYYYPDRDIALKEAEKLRQAKEAVWREPPFYEDIYRRLRRNIALFIKRLKLRQ